MTKAEWIEVSVIAVLIPIGWLAWPQFSGATPLWQIVLGLSALLLVQSLVRDVAILLRSRRSPSNGPRKEAQCFCLESTVGSTGVAVGAVLAGFGGSTQVVIGRWEFSLAAAATMTLGFLVKDLVISWKPFGLRREADHLNLIVRWKI
jgi:small-conductance mechanosensitive channel